MGASRKYTPNRKSDDDQVNVNGTNNFPLIDI